MGLSSSLRCTRGEAAANRRQLLLGCHLLGEECGLNTLHQAFEPTNELGLGHREFSLARGTDVAERTTESKQLIVELYSK